MVRASGGLVWLYSSLRAVQWLVGAAEALAGGGYKSVFAPGAAWLGRTAESVVGAELSGPSSGGTWHRRGLLWRRDSSRNRVLIVTKSLHEHKNTVS